MLYVKFIFYLCFVVWRRARPWMTQKVQPTPTAATRPTVRKATPAAKPKVLPSVS